MTDIKIEFYGNSLNKENMNKFIEQNKNKALEMDAFQLFSNLPNESVDATFFDPQYRPNLDKLKYGNEGKSRMKGRSKLKQMSFGTICAFILEIERVLKPSSYMYLWVDKFVVAEGVHSQWLNSTFEKEKLILVDMIVWDKQSFGMGSRTRRTNEFLMVYQKPPKIAKTWKRSPSIRDTWSEKIINPRSGHAHRKPPVLQSTLLKATLPVGSLVLDPCAGSFTTWLSAKMSEMDFIGCDLDTSNVLDILKG